jgi:predicted ArsR family transcriptional regulator
MDLPVRSDDVLSQRTRARIFAWLVGHQIAASTEELASGLDLHPNGIRRHLEILSEAGLVERRQSKGRRGRPGDLWLVAAGAHPGGERPVGYGDLARWLARAIPAGRNRLREVEKAGREIGGELAPRADLEDPVEGFRQVMAALGFQPDLDVAADGGFVCRLENCPYRDSVRENPDVVCALHRGITAGLLAELMPAAKLERFEPQDPELAGCMVGVAGRGQT